MRVDPTEEVVKSEQYARRYQRRMDRITRIIALVVAFLSTFGFLVKIVLF